MFKRLLQPWLLSLLCLAALLTAPGAGAQLLPRSGQGTPSAVVSTPYVRAELVALAPQGVGPGQPLWLGLQITHQPEWHTYWKNPGDSGLPIVLEWALPAGLDAGDIAWPVPKRFPIGSLMNYGYEGTVLLPVPVTVASGFSPGPLARELPIRLRASWLVCRKECIPEEGEFALSLPVQGSTALHAAAFEAAWAAAPKAHSADGLEARVDNGSTLALTVPGLPAAWRGQTLELFAETAGVIETAATPTQGWKDGVWTATLPLSAQRSAAPEPLPVVLALQGQGLRAELPVQGGWPPMAAAATISPALEEALRANAAQAAMAQTAASSASLWVALAGALLGGLILNLMPCVFPVLAIKLVGFAQHAHAPRARRLGGLAYTAGVVVSFLALGALLLALRAAGEAVGWGFQLQSPAVVAALAVLFTVIGLNLAGVFEFGHVLPSSVASLQARHPVADSFLTGVLAVAVASPCTAPFMGASLGLAATLPAVQALAVFGALGLGLALPYLLASWVPAVANALPRPGAWMDVLRRAMAFPMFATVVWLVWVLGQQSGIDGAGALLALLVAVAMLVWALTLAGRTRWLIGSLALLALLGVLAGGLGAQIVRPAEATAPTPAVAAEGTLPAATWTPWTPGRPEALLAAGQPVFIDFTAAWCVTCQYNKKTTLADERVMATFREANVALLRADWTRRDPAITAALAALGRNGVPVYVFQRPGQAPVVLSEVLGVDEVRAAVTAR
ncbi:protein-disulfide reductase DsbD family protein [Acidovorax lacteus]|uniref:Thioredoxin family protein n=1 Tax=Acidovorax lacteus TaxID=1924988 RepID=A0ABP8KV86_9BURK